MDDDGTEYVRRQSDKMREILSLGYLTTPVVVVVLTCLPVIGFIMTTESLSLMAVAFGTMKFKLARGPITGVGTGEHLVFNGRINMSIMSMSLGRTYTE